MLLGGCYEDKVTARGFQLTAAYDINRTTAERWNMKISLPLRDLYRLLFMILEGCHEDKVTT